jgi:hypothetical protein
MYSSMVHLIIILRRAPEPNSTHMTPSRFMRNYFRRRRGAPLHIGLQGGVSRQHSSYHIIWTHHPCRPLVPQSVSIYGRVIARRHMDSVSFSKESRRCQRSRLRTHSCPCRTGCHLRRHQLHSCLLSRIFVVLPSSSARRREVRSCKAAGLGIASAGFGPCSPEVITRGDYYHLICGLRL